MNLGTLDKKDIKDLLETAKDHFSNAQYALAEPILEQLARLPEPSAEVFHMLGTIYFDRGKFNKAIKTYRRALQADPNYTDAAVGLSIILNDLGRYEEGKQVFKDAQAALKQQSATVETFASEKLAMKHDELGELYFQTKKFNEALEQYRAALRLAPRRNDIRMKIVDCYLKMQQEETALKELRTVIMDQPAFTHARLKLGLLLYQKRRVAEAVDQWEAVLRRDPDHPLALQYLQMAQRTQSTELL